MMTRIVVAEVLDGLAERDPSAMRSRRDLRRVHRAMGTRGIVLRSLRATALYGRARRAPAPLRVLELGAGDGSLMLGVAGALRGLWPAVELTLLDRRDVVEPSTVARYAERGWSATPLVTDVLAWAANDGNPLRASHAAPPRWDLIVANLFLHHFEGALLATLLSAIAARTGCFLACEPRRARVALAGSHLVGLLGANAVTREDAVTSVHAGFRDREISDLWPAHAAHWTLAETPAGLFSHCFRAERTDDVMQAAP